MSLPKIIYGTAWKKERTKELVVSAVLHGFRAIDTACQPKHYDEKLVGDALSELAKDHGIQRESLFIQTKFTSINGQDRSKPLPYDPRDSITQQVLTSFQTSLSNLRTTYLDSYILHSPLDTLSQTLEAWRVLANLQDGGKVKMIGMSNTYDVGILEAMEKERAVQVVQNRWWEGNEWDRDVVLYCKGKKILSFWTLTGSPSLLASTGVKSLSQTLGITREQAVYKFAQHLGIVPLSGTTKVEHMEEDVRLAQVELDGEAVDAYEKTKVFIRF